MKKTAYSMLLSTGILALALTACQAVPDPVELRWLGDAPPEVEQGMAWGVPWPQGACTPETTFSLKTADGTAVPVSSWPLAYWPDGTLKWSGHAALASSSLSGHLSIAPGEPAVPAVPLKVEDREQEIRIDTGRMNCVIDKTGGTLFRSMEIEGTKLGGDLRPVGYVQNGPSDSITNLACRELVGRVQKTVLEQQNPVRAVVRVDGVYDGGFSKAGIIPFSARLYFVAGSPSVRVVCTVRYEGDEKRDYIRGLGLRVNVPLREGTLNRHVLFAGEGEGVWHEAVRTFSARSNRLEPDSVDNLKRQLAGLPLEAPEAYGAKREAIINDLAEWDGYRLSQGSADSFSVVKRTGAESCWLKSNWGGRSRGLAFAGDTSGGLVFGLRDFWETYPSSLEIDGMTADSADMTLWFWPPDGPAMDLRHYDTKAHGLSASYEDYEEGHSTPYGVARTFEVTLNARASVPSNEDFSRLADAVATPALLVCSPEYYHSIPVFGRWSLPDTSTPSKIWLEERLTLLLDYLKGEIESRHWYGFWDYGDVMHQYDTVRHQWKYDLGGFAWDNTELAPNLWLWYSFLRTGDADVYRMAEAMTRHTSEVDMYHSGPLMGLGSRHNVRHWGGGAKEVRISQSIFHRPYYYLTADERVGDIMASVADNEQALIRLNPLRKVADRSDWPTQARIGPDWFALAGDWFTAWERTGDERYREKIKSGMQSILSLPHQLFTGPYLNYDPGSGAFGLVNGKVTAEATHMASIFGGAELMFELTDQIDYPEWSRAWLEFCERYNWKKEEWEAHGLIPPKPGAFPEWHGRLQGYAAALQNNPGLAARAWNEFLFTEREGIPEAAVEVAGPAVLNPVMQMSWGSVNHMSQWSLNAIELLEFSGQYVPDTMPKEYVGHSD